jgi:hypothetical protein
MSHGGTVGVVASAVGPKTVTQRKLFAMSSGATKKMS